MAVIIFSFLISSACLSCAQKFKDKQSVASTVFLFCAWLVPTCIVGLRSWNVGTDSWDYAQKFELFTPHDLKIRDYLAPCYTCIQFLLRSFGLYQYQYLFIVMAAISFALLIGSLWKLSKIPAISLFILLSFGNLIESTNQYRQFLATSIVLFALTFLYEDKLLIYYILILVACGCHPTAAVCLLIPFFMKYPISHKSMMLAGILAVPIFAILTPLARKIMLRLPYIQDYVGSEFDIAPSIKNVAVYGFRFAIFVGILLIMQREHGSDRDEEQIGTFFYGILLQALALVLPVLARLPFYAVQISSILVPTCMSLESRRKNDKIWLNRKLYSNIVLLIFALYFIADCYAKKFMWENYSFFWQEPTIGHLILTNR